MGEGVVKFIIRIDVMYVRESSAFVDVVGVEVYVLYKCVVDVEILGDVMEVMCLFCYCCRFCLVYVDFVGI